MNRAFVVPALLLSLLGAGCSKKDTPSDAEAATSATAAVQAPLSSSATPAPVGVAECDDYLQKWEACIRRTGALTSLQALKAQRQSFFMAARTPEGKEGLAKTCQSLSDKLATSKACSGAPK
jgi:hypothetical protein